MTNYDSIDPLDLPGRLPGEDKIATLKRYIEEAERLDKLLAPQNRAQKEMRHGEKAAQVRAVVAKFTTFRIRDLHPLLPGLSNLEIGSYVQHMSRRGEVVMIRQDRGKAVYRRKGGAA